MWPLRQGHSWARAFSCSTTLVVSLTCLGWIFVRNTHEKWRLSWRCSLQFTSTTHSVPHQLMQHYGKWTNCGLLLRYCTHSFQHVKDTWQNRHCRSRSLLLHDIGAAISSLKLNDQRAYMQQFCDWSQHKKHCNCNKPAIPNQSNVQKTRNCTLQISYTNLSWCWNTLACGKMALVHDFTRILGS